MGGCRVGAGVRKEPELQYSVHLSLHLTPGIQSRIGEQLCWLATTLAVQCSAAPKTSSEIPPAPASRCFNGSPLSVLQPISRKAPPPSPISPHNCIRICPFDQVANVANAHPRGARHSWGISSAFLALLWELWKLYYAKYISSLQILQIEVIPLNIRTLFGLTSGSMSSELWPGPPNAAWVLLFR